VNTPIFGALAGVRKRQHQRTVLRLVILGLLVSSLASAAVETVRGLTGWPPTAWVALALLAAGPLVGLLYGWRKRPGWDEAARAVDRHYQLKDRAITALDFAGRPHKTFLHTRQLEDAALRLGEVNPRQVVSLRPPRPFPWAVGGLVLAVALLLRPTPPPAAVAAPPEPRPEILAEAERIEDELSEMEQQAQGEQSEELNDLLRQLRDKVQEMKQPGVGTREMLAKLSEMQAMLAAEQAKYDTTLVDEHLKAVGEAMNPAAALEAAAKALQEGKLEKAAQELDKLNEPKMDPKEARTVEEHLREEARKAEEKGLKQLGEAAEDMAKGAGGQKGQFRKGARDLARQARQQQQRRRLQQLLGMQQNRLSDCKSRCASSTLTWLDPPPNQNQKDASQQSKAGKEKGGKLYGNKTRTPTGKNRQEITGQDTGVGASEVDTENTQEARQEASRLQRDRYKKYLRQSEAVLENEPIPLGHRETIRRYFELIRPESADDEVGKDPRSSR
jgi:hypothetical protein